MRPGTIVRIAFALMCAAVVPQAAAAGSGLVRLARIGHELPDLLGGRLRRGGASTAHPGDSERPVRRRRIYLLDNLGHLLQSRRTRLRLLPGPALRLRDARPRTDPNADADIAPAARMALLVRRRFS